MLVSNNNTDNVYVAMDYHWCWKFDHICKGYVRFNHCVRVWECECVFSSMLYCKNPIACVKNEKKWPTFRFTMHSGASSSSLIFFTHPIRRNTRFFSRLLLLPSALFCWRKNACRQERVLPLDFCTVFYSICVAYIPSRVKFLYPILLIRDFWFITIDSREKIK